MPSTMRDWWRAPAIGGASRAKLALAAVLVAAAAGVLLHDVSGGDAPPRRSGAGAALALSAGGTAAVAPASMTAPAPAPPAPPGSTASPEIGAAAAATPAIEAAAPASVAGAEPDWGALFAELMAREDARTAAAGEASTSAGELAVQLAHFRLRGIVQEAGGGVALVNSRLLRVGDTLEGTTLTISEIRSDRLLLKAGRSPRPVELLLEPMLSGSGLP